MKSGRNPYRSPRLFRRFLIALAFGGAPAALGATINWTNAGTGDWSLATNWSSNPSLPGPADIVRRAA